MRGRGARHCSCPAAIRCVHQERGRHACRPRRLAPLAAAAAASDVYACDYAADHRARQTDLPPMVEAHCRPRGSLRPAQPRSPRGRAHGSRRWDRDQHPSRWAQRAPSRWQRRGTRRGKSNQAAAARVATMASTPPTPRPFPHTTRCWTDGHLLPGRARGRDLHPLHLCHRLPQGLHVLATVQYAAAPTSTHREALPRRPRQELPRRVPRQRAQ